MADQKAAKALAEALTRRMELLGMSQQELAQRANVSTSTIRKLQRGAQTSYQRPKLAALSRALEWSPDTIARGLAGIDISGLVEEPAGDRRPLPGPAATDIGGDLAALIAQLQPDQRRFVAELVGLLLSGRR